MKGLSSIEASKQLKTYGRNEVIPAVTFTFFQEVKKILLDPGGMMFLILGILYWILGDHTNAFLLFGAWIPITTVDVLLNIRSSKALKALRGTLTVHAKVYRDGIIKDIPIHQLVPRDVMVFEEGQTLPADGKIIEATHLHVSEAALTGESLPIEKKSDDEFYAGTIVLSGQALGLVEKTGKNTRYGTIGELLRETIETVSPLRKKIDQLFKTVFLIALGLAALLFVIEWSRHRAIIPSLIVAFTLGMSAIPEEFPLVFTLYLSLGAWRLSQKRVLVKSLPSVEALGGVDVICTDKTGTLTLGSFELEETHRWKNVLNEQEFWVTALMACEIHPVDPMEMPVFKKGESYLPHLQNWKLTQDRPFDPVTKTMAHTWKSTLGNQIRICMKGALEGVLKHCILESSDISAIHTINQTYTQTGKRVLALAVGTTADEPSLQFAGFLIYSDPIRPDVKPAIRDCQNAGIEIKMITGDHLLTAHAIADQIGLIHSHDHLYTGDELTRMSTQDREQAFLKGAVFARVSPEQKHEMVKALKASGKVVAMTGDGINDAPALRLADIGISMGKSATDVARSTARMVLIENDFAGIVDAVFEGRNVFSNLRKSFSYLISFHTPVILLALIPPFLGWPSILMSSHIILLELVVHPVSAITFEKSPDRTKQRSDQKSFLNREQWLTSIGSGLILSLVCLIQFHQKQMNDPEQARNEVFAMILFGNTFFVGTGSFPDLNRKFWATAILILSTGILISTHEPIAAFLHFKPIEASQLIWAFLKSSLCIIPNIWVAVHPSTQLKSDSLR